MPNVNSLLLTGGVAAMALAMPGLAHALPINAFGAAEATCFDQRQSQIASLDGVDCFVSLSGAHGSNTSSATAQILGSTSAAVHAAALHAKVGNPAPGNAMINGWSAFAEASLLYDVNITLISDPSASVPFLVPVLETHHLFGFVEADDGSRARLEAGSSVTITDRRNNRPLLSHSIGTGATGADDTYNFSSSQVLFMQPNVDYLVDILARCAIERDGGSEPAATSCVANTDPTFQFDQAAFDAQMGPNTFPLADVFEFRFSPNLVNPPVAVTEPATWLLLLAMQAAFVARRIAWRRSLVARGGSTSGQRRRRHQHQRHTRDAARLAP